MKAIGKTAKLCLGELAHWSHNTARRRMCWKPTVHGECPIAVDGEDMNLLTEDVHVEMRVAYGNSQQQQLFLLYGELNL